MTISHNYIIGANTKPVLAESSPLEIIINEADGSLWTKTTGGAMKQLAFQDLSALVDIASTQTISGAKTFSNHTNFTNNVVSTYPEGAVASQGFNQNGGFFRINRWDKTGATTRGIEMFGGEFDERSQIGGYGNSGGGLAIGGNNTGSNTQTVAMFFNPQSYAIDFEAYDGVALVKYGKFDELGFSHAVAPTLPEHLANKLYVDSLIAAPPDLSLYETIVDSDANDATTLVSANGYTDTAIATVLEYIGEPV